MIFGISKTTINGVLALLITILTAVLSYQVPTALLDPQLSRTWLWVTAVCTFVCGILRSIVGLMQNDAPPPAPNLSSNIPVSKIAPLLLLVVLLPMFALSGCKTASVAAPLAPGYITPAEQVVGEAISAGNRAVLQYEADVKSGAYTPTPVVTGIVSSIQRALVIADPLAVAWHNSLLANASASEPPALATAVSTINSNINSIPGGVQ